MPVPLSEREKSQNPEGKLIQALTIEDMQTIAEITGGTLVNIHAAISVGGIEGCFVSWPVEGPVVYLTLITGVLHKEESDQLDRRNTPLLLLQIGGGENVGFSRSGTVNLDGSTVTISDPKGPGIMNRSLSLTIERGEHDKPGQIIFTQNLQFRPTA